MSGLNCFGKRERGGTTKVSVLFFHGGLVKWPLSVCLHGALIFVVNVM